MDGLAARPGKTWPAAAPPRHGALHDLLPFALVAAVVMALPFSVNDYWLSIATRAAVYWVLVAGLNLIVGFGGQLAIGWVALLTVGAYADSILVAGNVLPPVPPLAALALSTVLGGVSGLVVGLPALRLRTFYFAMTTLGFATIVTQIAVAWQDVTGGGMGLPGPELPHPFDSPAGFYAAAMIAAAAATVVTANVAGSRFGRALVAVRDSEVAAEASGISKARVLGLVFVLGGALAAASGSLFATLQTYITPDAFTFDLSVLFFISILIGGQNSILGPLLGTALLTVLPELAAPLAAWSNFLYAAMLLVIVVLLPGGISRMLDFKNRRALDIGRAVVPDAALVKAVLSAPPQVGTLALDGIVLSFGGVRAVDGLALQVEPGTIHGLIGPNGSGKTTTLNVVSGYVRPQEGRLSIGGRDLVLGHPVSRAGYGIARSFQTPRVVGELSALSNVMVGGTVHGRASFLETLFCLPRHIADERRMRAAASLALRAVGLAGLDHVRADRLQHSELRFLEIARALLARPTYLLLDEPAAGLSAAEIRSLGGLIQAIAAQGVGVLLVEHHADLIFDVCQRVTVLNLGRILAAGTPVEIRAHQDVIDAYLGG